MGRPKSRIDCEESSSSSGRAKGERWSQDEMDTLVSLCITHGRSGILSKETNKATCAKKDAQWATILTTYNTIHPPRDKSALIARYKFIVMHLRKDNAAQRSSVVTTGGGRSTSSKPPFEITAKMLELTNILGVSITGLPGFGSDSHAMETVTQTATEGDHGENAHSLETFSAPADNDEREEWSYEFLLDNAASDHWVDHAQKTLQQPTQDKSKSIVTDTIADVFQPASGTPPNILQNSENFSSTAFPGRSSFFPTQSQRRVQKRKATEASAEKNLQRQVAALEKNEERKAAKHAAEMHYEARLIEAKLEELRENAVDRKLKRERRAELHAMTVRHQESLFELQKEVLIAQRDAFLRATGSNVLQLAMPHIGMSASISPQTEISKEDDDSNEEL